MDRRRQRRLHDRPTLGTVAVQASDPASLLNHYRRLIRLHTGHPALARGDVVPLKTGNPAVAAFLRTTAEETVLVLLNFGKEQANGITVAADASVLAPGTYSLAPLLDDLAATPLTVAAGGAIAAAPLPPLAPQTGYVFALNAATGLARL